MVKTIAQTNYGMDVDLTLGLKLAATKEKQLKTYYHLNLGPPHVHYTSISKNFEFKYIVGIYATKSTETSIVKLLMITPNHRNKSTETSC